MNVWALTGGRAGDDAQVLTAAAVFGEFRQFNLRYNHWREFPNSLKGASLRSLQSGGEFAAPWPDVVISTGRRSPPIAKWIRKQSRNSSRLIHIGRPRAPLDWFDLVLTTPQYGVAHAPNVYRLTLPLTRIQPIGRSRDHVLIVLGGDSWAARITPQVIDKIAMAGRSLATKLGLPLCATTSSRTSPTQIAHLRSALGDDAIVRPWRSGDTTNTYAEWLATAAEIVISGDSISILSDAVMTDRPVTVALPSPPGWLRAVRKAGGRPWLEQGGNMELFAPPPNLQAVWDQLSAKGVSEAAEDGMFRVTGARGLILEEREEAIARIKAFKR